MAPAFSDPFTMKKIEDILNITNQQQPSMTQLSSPQQARPQEQAGGKEMVDRAIENQIRSAPNPYEISLQNDILGAKQKYQIAQDIYNNPTSTDQQRLLAQQGMTAQNELANRLRNVAQASGFNTSPYAEGKSLSEVQNYLDTEQAKNIVEGISGAYSMNPDQYYERKYEEAIMRGLSHRRAKRLAGSQAREYQANRVAYLNGVFNSYGVGDDGTTNSIGTQILGMIAQDNPMLANFYAQVYPNQRDAYNTNQQIAMEALKHSNLQDIIGLNFANTLKQMGVADMYNANQQYRGGEITRQNAEYNSNLQLQNELAKYQFDLDKEYQKQLAISQEKAAEYEQKVYLANGWANALGLQQGTPEYAAFVIENIGGKIPESLTKSKERVVEKILEIYKATQKEEEIILKELGSLDLPEEEREKLQDKLREIQNYKDHYYSMFGEYAGFAGDEYVQEYTGNAEQDRQTASALLSKLSPTATREQVLESFKKWIHDSSAGRDVPDWTIEAFVNELLGIQNDSATSQSPPTSPTARREKQNYPEKANQSYKNAQIYNSAQFLQPR